MSTSETDTHMYDAALCKEIIRIFPDMKTFVDIGCGDGSYTKALNEGGFIC